MRDFAVLLMAYGSPRSDEDIEDYLTDIRRGRKPTPQAVQSLRDRYHKIGGHSPLLDITKQQASGLEKTLSAKGVSARVYVGMKHWHPYISEVLPDIVDAGFHRIVAVALAPHYSRISIGGYKQTLGQGLAQFSGLEASFVESWYDDPIFVRAVAERVNDALGGFPYPGKVEILFTAHSLPERILQNGDPYPAQLHDSCQSVADLIKPGHWSFAYQSAGETGEKWLGPDILEALQKIVTDRKGSDVLVVPIGFVADHLEILYDIDVEAQELAGKLGLNLKRTQSLNTSPTFIEALTNVVLERAKIARWS